MRHRLFAVSTWLLIAPVAARAGIAVEQIEAYEVDTGDNSNAPTRYAPLDFAGASSVTLQAGQLGGYFTGIDFHALGGTATTNSNHAYAVAEGFYGDASVAYPYVSNVYAAPANQLVVATAGTRTLTGIGAAPDSFPSGVVVVNNSYVYATGAAASDLDLQRRLDFMIDQSDVTFVTAAVSNTGTTTNYETPWSSFNSLAVSGNAQTFSVIGSQGKQHADVYLAGEASFSAAAVSGYAAALYGTAQTAGQTDALHNEVIRSLLMAGADKGTWSRQTANNLSVSNGAGTADYTSSLAILNAGETPLLRVGSGSAVSGTPNTDQRGWAEGTIPANSQDVVLFDAAFPLTGLTASLNWDVTSSQPSAGEINTSTSALLFADLSLEVRPVTLTNGKYVLGASLADSTFHSDATGDNVQYLYSTDSLPAGNYAFVITGDSGLSPIVGFSYALSGTFPNDFKATGGSWATAGNWQGGVPNSSAAQVGFTGASGLGSSTLTLDGSKTVGQLFFSGTTNYTIAQGTGGTLTINDTGDTSNNPLISIASGNQTISAPVALTNGLTVSVAASSSLNIGGAITGTGGLTKTGSGPLTLAGADNYGNTTITAGALTLATTASLAGTLTLAGGTSLNIPASTGSGIFVHALGSNITLASGVTATIGEPSALANRQVLQATNIVLAGSANNWTSQLVLGDNDLDLSGASLANVTNQIKQGLATGTTGITSVDVGSDPNHLVTLGVMVNNDGAGHAVYGNGGTLGLFDTASPGLNDVLVKYTYVGDSNLDGLVTAADYTLIDTGFTNHLTGWYNGDYNYDGVVNGDDFTLIDNAFPTPGDSTPLIATEAASFGSAGAVPEPAPIALLLAAGGAIALGARRRARA